MLTGAAALVALVAVSGIAFSTFAADDTDTATDRPFRTHAWENLSDEAKAEMEALRAERQAERETRRAEMSAAINEGYDAWVAAVNEQQGADALILSQINADNFERFAEGHGYMEQGRAIFDELGIDDRGHMGRKGFGGHGGKPGGCRGMMGDASGAQVN